MKLNLSLVVPLAVAAVLIPMAVGQKADSKDSESKIVEAVPKKAFAEPRKKRRMLVFSVTNGFRHASIATGKIAMEKLGAQTGAFEAVVSDDLSNFESDKIVEFDAICFLNTTQDVFAPGKKEAGKMSPEEKKAAIERGLRLRQNLMDFVKGGGGFVGIHAATDTLYGWKEYGEMMNGYFSGHPWGAGTEVSIKVDPGAEKHPIVAHLEGKNLDFKEEIYQLKDPYDSSKVQMLLRLDTDKSNMKVGGIKRTDNDFGVSWVRTWGKGRVFYCSLGHNHHIYWNPDVLKVYLGGIQYALGDFEVPTK